MKEEISWGSPVTKLETFRCQKPPRNRKRRMACLARRIGCASLEQAGTSEAQLEGQRTGTRSSSIPRKVCVGCPGLSGQQPAPALPAVLPSPALCPVPLCQEELPSGKARPWGGLHVSREFLAKKPAVMRKMGINSCRLRTIPRAYLKTKQWGTIWNQSPNFSETPSQTLHKVTLGCSPWLSLLKSLT